MIQSNPKGSIFKSIIKHLAKQKAETQQRYSFREITSFNRLSTLELRIPALFGCDPWGRWLLKAHLCYKGIVINLVI